MCAGIFDFFPGDVWDSRCWSSVDVVLILLEESINKMLHVLGIPIVNGGPCILYDLINFVGVCGVRTWLVWCVWVWRSLYGLHGLGVLLFDCSVDVCLAVIAMEPGRRCLLGLLAYLLVLFFQMFLVLFV